MHILVVEDERALCETIVRSLRRLAYSVDFCCDGNKAIELLGAVANAVSIPPGEYVRKNETQRN